MSVVSCYTGDPFEIEEGEPNATDPDRLAPVRAVGPGPFDFWVAKLRMDQDTRAVAPALLGSTPCIVTATGSDFVVLACGTAIPCQCNAEFMERSVAQRRLGTES